MGILNRPPVPSLSPILLLSPCCKLESLPKLPFSWGNADLDTDQVSGFPDASLAQPSPLGQELQALGAPSVFHSQYSHRVHRSQNPILWRNPMPEPASSLSPLLPEFRALFWPHSPPDRESSSLIQDVVCCTALGRTGRPLSSWEFEGTR